MDTAITHDGLPTDAPWLIMLFRPRLGLALVPRDAGPEFKVGDAPFRAKTGGEITAFYDRLYGPTERLVGLQITPLLAEEYLPMVVARCPYVRVIENDRVFRVFLFDEPLMNPAVSADQAFGGRIYETVAGEFAMSVDTFFLSPAERAALQQANAEWIHVRTSDQ